MIKDISDFNIIPGIFLFYQMAGPKWWILSLWEEQMIFSVGRKQHGGSHFLLSGGMVVSSGASFGRRDRRAQIQQQCSRYERLGFFYFVGGFFFYDSSVLTSHIRDLRAILVPSGRSQ